jgi:hypothetical protein
MIILRIRIGNVSPEIGTRAHGELMVGRLHNGTPVSIPFTIVSGAEDGPALHVMSGLSANGASAIEAARRIAANTDPKTLKGTLIVTPIVNMPAFLTRSKNNILENYTNQVDLHTSFPGSPDGPLTHRIAHIITTEVICKAEYAIDLHNSDAGGRYEPFTVVYKIPEPLRTKALQLARAFGLRHIREPKTEVPGRPANAAASKGVALIMVECGESNNQLLECDIETQVRGVRNCMKHLAMIEGQPEIPKEQIVSSEVVTLRTNLGGFLSLKRNLGEHISKGQVFAEVTDVFCDLTETIMSPVDGYVERLSTSMTVGCGDKVGHIVTVERTLMR